MKVAIIGGSGKMGRWFADFLLKDGKEVVIIGRDEKKLLEAGRQLGVETATNVEAIRSADVILLSVPVESFEEVVRQISPHVHEKQVVADITSAKTFPVAIMHQYLTRGVVLGVHPLFGPGAKGVANQNFILTPTAPEEEALSQKVREFLEARRAKVSIMTPEEHDELMAIVLGLPHFIAIVSADALLSSHKLRRIGTVSGITYKVLLTLIESVVSEDAELYASLQMNLPGITEMEKLFHSRVKEWADLVKNKDREAFVRRMRALKDRLEQDTPDFGKAYENMYRIAEGL